LDDLVAFLDGGPGGAATEDYPAIAPALMPLTEQRDILLLDQRGTGSSHPLTCPEDQDRTREISDSSEALKRCLAAVREHADPRFYTTSIAVQDLEAVRHALGSPALDLVAVSYGTRLAQQYAARHPQAVRSVILDSAVPNELILGTDFGRSLEEALRARFALCAKGQRLP
jgi:pimeloyl-ACP methyl ester carboxylesterase